MNTNPTQASQQAATREREHEQAQQRTQAEAATQANRPNQANQDARSERERAERGDPNSTRTIDERNRTAREVNPDPSARQRLRDAADKFGTAVRECLPAGDAQTKALDLIQQAVASANSGIGLPSRP